MTHPLVTFNTPVYVLKCHEGFRAPIDIPDAFNAFCHTRRILKPLVTLAQAFKCIPSTSQSTSPQPWPDLILSKPLAYTRQVSRTLNASRAVYFRGECKTVTSLGHPNEPLSRRWHAGRSSQTTNIIPFLSFSLLIILPANSSKVILVYPNPT